MYYPGSSNSASGCYANSVGADVAATAASNLGDLVLQAYANYDGSGNDEGILCSSITTPECTSFSTTDQVVDLYQYWHYSEFNIFGWGGGSEANFNSGTSLTITNALTDQSGNAITPSCYHYGYTAETNNLNLGSCSSSSGEIIFAENNGDFATLTTSVASGQGSVSPSCPSPVSCQQAVGSPVSVTATPSSGWQFTSWTLSGASCSSGSTTNPCQFNMPSNSVTVSVTFTQLTFILITRVDSGTGTVSPSYPSGEMENAGTPITVTATASSGWVFGSWSTQTGISCSGNPCRFTMPSNAVTLGVTFAETTTISLSLSSSSVSLGSTVTLSGSISPNPGAVTVTVSNSGTPILSVTTSSGGSYSQVWKPPYPGSYSLQASWGGNTNFAASQSSTQSLMVTGTAQPIPTLLLSSPATTPNGQTVTLQITVFNNATSQLNANVTIEITGPNNYVLFNVIPVQVAASSHSTGYYDWAVPTQTGSYTIMVSMLPPSTGGVDLETIQVM